MHAVLPGVVVNGGHVHAGGLEAVVLHAQPWHTPSFYWIRASRRRHHLRCAQGGGRVQRPARAGGAGVAAGAPVDRLAPACAQASAPAAPSPVKAWAPSQPGQLCTAGPACCWWGGCTSAVLPGTILCSAVGACKGDHCGLSSRLVGDALRCRALQPRRRRATARHAAPRAQQGGRAARQRPACRCRPISYSRLARSAAPAWSSLGAAGLAVRAPLPGALQLPCAGRHRVPEGAQCG